MRMLTLKFLFTCFLFEDVVLLSHKSGDKCANSASIFISDDLIAYFNETQQKAKAIGKNKKIFKSNSLEKECYAGKVNSYRISSDRVLYLDIREYLNITNNTCRDFCAIGVDGIFYDQTNECQNGYSLESQDALIYDYKPKGEYNFTSTCDDACQCHISIQGPSQNCSTLVF